MKNLLLLFAGLFLFTASLKAQNCTLIATVNCNRTLTAVVPAAVPASSLWVCQLTQGGTVVETASVQPDGRTFNFTTVLVDSTDYAVTYHNGFSLGCGYSTYIMWSIPGKVVQGCSGGSTCNVSYLGCGVTPSPAPAPAPTTPGNNSKKPKK